MKNYKDEIRNIITTIALIIAPMVIAIINVCARLFDASNILDIAPTNRHWAAFLFCTVVLAVLVSATAFAAIYIADQVNEIAFRFKLTKIRKGVRK